MQPYSHRKQALFSGANDDGFQGLRALTGAGVGGLAGAGLGGLGGLIGEAFFAKPDQAQYLRRALQGAGIGGLAGLGLGAGIGASRLGQDIQYALEDRASEAHRNLVRTILQDVNAGLQNTKIEGIPFADNVKIRINVPDLPPRPEFTDKTLGN